MVGLGDGSGGGTSRALWFWLPAPGCVRVAGEIGYWRASEFEMSVLAANRFDRKILIDAVPGISPWIHLGDFLSRSC